MGLLSGIINFFYGGREPEQLNDMDCKVIDALSSAILILNQKVHPGLDGDLSKKLGRAVEELKKIRLKKLNEMGVVHYNHYLSYIRKQGEKTEVPVV